MSRQKNRVYVEYTRHTEREEEGSAEGGESGGSPEEEEAAARRSAAPRAVARKSTAQNTAAAPSPPPMLTPTTDRLISPISPMEGDGQITEVGRHCCLVGGQYRPWRETVRCAVSSMEGDG